MVFRRIIENSVIEGGERSLIKDQSVHSYIVVFNVLINRSFDESIFFLKKKELALASVSFRAPSQSSNPACSSGVGDRVQRDANEHVIGRYFQRANKPVRR